MDLSNPWLWLAASGLLLAALGLLALSPLIMGRLLAPRFTLALFRRFGWALAGLLGRMSPELDLRLIVKAGNRYFKKAFAATPFGRRVLFLPFCLRPLECPAGVDPDEGLLCSGGCPECEVGRVRAEALELGYAAVYVVPSSRIMRGKGLMPSDQFIKHKIKQHGFGAAVGVTCPWHMRNRLLARYTLKNGRTSSLDQGSGGSLNSALQGVLMDRQNCRHGAVNWALVRRSLRLTQD
ncbi:MAG: DUF116 domain-containing protein [Desulfarculaceae bacterium]|nr:DUF116 domain-containing protein [Desulfarculaceae bacterium]MCF8074211.1 DUF116 domain-containing protein [Desulfarculaceae bacterium]MCF8103837.1 DUF116 domain-containing protein [Desulfarculaceae bacterium]MCF8116353.1 DUF116 domain-containing protein [Desulfarculaceae bacterium]